MLGRGPGLGWVPAPLAPAHSVHGALRAQSCSTQRGPQALPLLRELPGAGGGGRKRLLCLLLATSGSTNAKHKVFLTLPQWPFACLKKRKASSERKGTLSRALEGARSGTHAHWDGGSAFQSLENPLAGTLSGDWFWPLF